MDSSLLPSSPKYKNARASLLVVLAFSLVNVFAVFANYYFYFSSRIALVLVAIGAQLDVAAGTNAFKFVFAFLAIASLVPYLLSWLFSKKKVGWMIVALVLFSVDTLVLLIDVPSAIAGKDFTIIIDVIVHAIVILELALGVKAGFDMKKEAIEAEEQKQEMQEKNEFLSKALGIDDDKKRKATFTREKSFAGCAIPIVVLVNGNEVCRLKNGKSETVEVPASAFELTAMMSNGFANSKLFVDAGEEDAAFSLKIKMGFSSATIEITKK